MADYVTMATIDQDGLSGFFVTVQPIEEQKRIIGYLEEETANIKALIKATSDSIAFLRERRSALIAAAVTGKIKVSS